MEPKKPAGKPAGKPTDKPTDKSRCLAAAKKLAERLRPGDRVSLTINPRIDLGNYNRLSPSVTVTRMLDGGTAQEALDLVATVEDAVRLAIVMELRETFLCARRYADDGLPGIRAHCTERTTWAFATESK
jgi:hypothetical protein